MSGGISQFQLSYEISPIILNNGIAKDVPGGMIPVVSLVQPQNFKKGLLSPAIDGSFDNFIAHFVVMAGGTLVESQIGTYPFANQQVAGNAIIVQALRVSLMMMAPAPSSAYNGGGYSLKLAAFTSLKKTLDQHNIAGGTYTVATPSFIYTDCLLLSLRDVSGGDTHQVQTRWQWDFLQPLLTLQAVQAAQNSLMAKVTNGTMTTGDPPTATGTANAAANPSSGVGPALIPAAQGTAGSSVGSSAARPGVPG